MTLINILSIVKVNSCHFSIFIYLYWIYWGDIDSQNCTDFKYITQQNPSAHCIVHPSPKGKSLSIRPPFPPLCPPPPTSIPPFPLDITTLLSMSMWYILYIQCLENVQPLLIWENGLHDMDVTWQPRRVDWNVRVWTKMTSLYYSCRYHWLSMCTVWPSHSKWLEQVEQWTCIKISDTSFWNPQISF